MAKKLLLGVLSDILGTYVDGFVKDNLEIGILSGTLEMNNLKLKTDALSNLPLSVMHGSIKKIFVDVPWVHLESKSVKIVVDGVFLQLGPIDVHGKTQADLKRLALLSRRSQLDKAEQAILKTADLDKEDVQVKVDKIAWSQQVAVKIADNIELYITNIHIRYEDSISIPGQTYAFGFTIASIKLCTTDENWKEAFVDRSDSKAVNKDVHKFGSIENVGFYWNDSDSPLDTRAAAGDHAQWVVNMQSLVYSNAKADANAKVANAKLISNPSSIDAVNQLLKSGNSSSSSSSGKIAGAGGESPHGASSTLATDELKYILKPTNLFTLKLTHRDTSTSTIPKIDVLIESYVIPFELSSQQFRQVLFTLRVMAQIEKQKQMSLYKPAKRPSDSPREWWRYAFKMVTGKGLGAASKFETLTNCLRLRKRYIELIKTGLYNKELSETTKSKSKKDDKNDKKLSNLIPGIHILSNEENEELFALEGLLPMSALTFFRQIAANEYVAEKHKRLIAAAEKEKSEKRSIFSFGSNKSKEDTIAGDSSPSSHGASASSINNNGDSGSGKEEKKKSFFSSKFSNIFGDSKKDKNKEKADGSQTSEIGGLTAANVGKLADASGSSALEGGGGGGLDNASVSDGSYVEDDDIMEKLRQKLIVAESSVTADEAFPIRIKLMSSASGDIKQTSTQSILGIQLSVAAEIEYKLAHLMATFCVNDFTAKDKFTSNSIEKYFLKSLHPISTDSEQKLMKVEFGVYPGSGRSQAAITALPLEIVVNGPCAKALFDMFVNSEVDSLSENVSMFANKKLLEIMQKYSDQGDVPVFGSLDFQVNIDAPKIVIVDTPSSDMKGCLVLDCGNLSVQGNMSPLGILLKTELNKVNMSLPATISSRSTFDRDDASNYLISPFDVSINLQSQEKSNANLSAVTEIAHPITITSDIQQLARLVGIGNVLFSIVQKKMEKHLPEFLPPPVPLVYQHSSSTNLPSTSISASSARSRRKSSNDTRSLSRAGSTDVGSGSMRTLMSQLSKKMGVASNPLEVKLGMKLKLSSINLRIKASPLPNHYLVFEVSDFAVDLKIRHYDQSAKITLSSVSLIDTHRCGAFKRLLSTAVVEDSSSAPADVVDTDKAVYMTRAAESDLRFANAFSNLNSSSASSVTSSDDYLITIEACKITNRHMSPLYTAYETELKLNLSSISLHIDAGCILRLESLLVGIKSLITEQIIIQKINLQKSIRESKALFEKSFNELAVDKTVKVTMKLQSIALELLHSATPLKGNMKMTDEGLELESAFELSIKDLYFCVDKSDTTLLLQSQLSLDSISIEDRRASSASFIYRKLFEKNNLGSQFSSSNPYNTSPNNVRSPRSTSDADIEDLDKLLLIKYEQKCVLPEPEAVCIIEVKSTTTVVNVDSILSLLGVLLQIADSGKTIANALNVPELQLISPELKREMMRELEADGISTVNKVLGSHFDLTFLVSNTRLILLEDPSSLNTRAIVSKCGILLQYTHDSSQIDEDNLDSEIETREKLRLSLQKAEVFVLSGMIVGNPEQLLEPLSYDINYNFSSIKKCHNVSTSLDDITLKVSYNDILLISSLVSRATDILNFNDAIVAELDDKSVKSSLLTLKRPAATASSTSSSASSSSSADSVLANLSFDFMFNFSVINFMLIDDYGTHRVPLIRLTISDSHTGIRIKGKNQVLSNEEGSLIVNLDFYNSRPAVWEPIIETWRPEFSIESITDLQAGSSIRLTSIDTMQLNISGNLIRSLHKFLHILQKNQVLNKRKMGSSTTRSLKDAKINATVTNGAIRGNKKNANSSDRIDQIFHTYEFGSSGSVIEDHEIGAASVKMNYPLVFVNELGLNVKVSCHTTRYLLCNMDGSKVSRAQISDSDLLAAQDSANMDRDSMNPGDIARKYTRRSRMTDIPMPQCFDVVIEGDSRVVTTKLSQLPLLSSKPKLYHVNRTNNDKLNPFYMFWDVKLLDNGTRAICLRSGFKIVNLMPFAIELKASFPLPSSSSSSSGQQEQKESVFLGPLQEGATLHLSLQHSDATQIQFRPVSGNEMFKFEFAWSDPIDCSPLDISFAEHKKRSSFMDMLCETNGENARTGSPSYQPPVYSRVALEKQGNHRLKLVLLPFAIIQNLLPCRFLFKCRSDDRSLQNGILEPGDSVQLYHVCPLASPQLSIQTGSYIFSQMRPVVRAKEIQKFSMDLVSPNDSSGGISLTMTSHLKSNGIIEVKIYSTYILMDRTGLNLSIKSKRFKSRESAEYEGEHALNDILERRTFDLNTSLQHFDPGSCWSDGAAGVALFQSADETATVAVCNKVEKEGSSILTAVWSEPLSLLSISSSKVAVELVDKANERSYLLSYSLSPLLDIFSASRVLKFMPWYGIVNCSDELIEVFQADNLKKEITSIPAKTTVGWHKANINSGTSLRIRTKSSMWSLGVIDINEIGSATLVLPKTDSNNAKEAIILRIEVKFAEKDEDCFMSVVIWRETITSDDFQNISVAIQNTTNFPVCVCQDLGQYVKEHQLFTKDDSLLYELCVPPESWAPFGWADMALPLVMEAAICTSLKYADPADSIRLDLNVHNDKKSLLVAGEEENGRIERAHVIEFEVQTRGGGYVILIREAESISQKEESDLRLSTFPQDLSEDVKANKRFVEFCMYLRSLNVSIIAESPSRREFFSLYIEGIELSTSTLVNIDSRPGSTSFRQRNTYELKILNLQLDNYSESVLHPVLIHTYDEQARKEHEKQLALKQGGDSSALQNSEPLNFLQFMLVKEYPNNSTFPIYKYVALRALEVQCAIDSSTIQILLLDLLPDMTGESISNSSISEDYYNPEHLDQTNDNSLNNGKSFREKKEDVQKWCSAYIEDLGRFNSTPLVDMQVSMNMAQSHRMYFESITMHPFKVRVTFSVSDFPRSDNVDIFQTYPWLRVTRGIAGIEDILLKINSFIVENVFETSQTLISRLKHKASNELKYQAAAVAGTVMGSLNLIGRPVGLLSKIGNGVKDVFYEPFEGAMISPKAFVYGIGKGTGSLVTNVLTGALTSVSSIVNSATKTIALGATTLTGDKEFERRREEKRREVKAAGGGFVSGLKAGGESFVTGFTSGITGLVTKPIQGAKKGGVLGFGKGFVQGVIGVPTKLVIGITEGLANVAQGATNEMSDVLSVSYARCPRAFRRSPIDLQERILVDLDLIAAKAQFYVKQLTKSYDTSDKARNDEFHSYLSLGYNVNPNTPKPDNKVFAVVISHFYIFLLNQDVEEIKKVAFSDISHCEYQPFSLSVKLVTYQGSQSGGSSSSLTSSSSGGGGGGFFGLGNKPTDTDTGVIINCYSEKECVNLYDLLVTLADKMGNPSRVIPLGSQSNDLKGGGNTISSSSSSSSSSRDVQSSSSSSSSSISATSRDSSGGGRGSTSINQAPSGEDLKQALANYKFGALNDLEFKSISLSSGDIIFGRAKNRLNKLSIAQATPDYLLDFLVKDFPRTVYQPAAVTYMQLLDLQTLHLSFEWKTNHTYLNRRKCCCLLFINLSMVPVQFKSVDLRQGSEFVELSTVTMDGRMSYIPDTKVVVEDGGSVIIFGTANRMADVQLRVQTTAGSIALITSSVHGNETQSSAGRNLGFAEKTITETWAKFVVICS